MPLVSNMEQRLLDEMENGNLYKKRADVDVHEWTASPPPTYTAIGNWCFMGLAGLNHHGSLACTSMWTILRHRGRFVFCRLARCCPAFIAPRAPQFKLRVLPAASRAFAPKRASAYPRCHPFYGTAWKWSRWGIGS